MSAMTRQAGSGWLSMRWRPSAERRRVAVIIGSRPPAAVERYRVGMAYAARRSSRSAAARSRSRTRTRSTSPRPGYTKLDLVHYYLAVADGALRGAGGRPMALKRFVDGDHQGAVLPEAGPGQHARLDPDRRADVPVRSDRRRDRARRAGGAGLGRQPRLHRPQPAPGPRRRPRPPGRAARRPRPGPGHRVAADPRRGHGLPRGARRRSGWSAGPRRRARAGIHINVRIERRWTYPEVRRAALALARDVERRAPGRRDLQVVEGGAPRRLPRLQPEREGPHGRVRLLGPARCPTRASRRRCRGTRSPTSEAEAFTIATVPERFADDRRPGRRDRRRGRIARRRSSSCRAQHEARGRGRRAVAAELRQAGRRAAARPAIAQARAPTPSTSRAVAQAGGPPPEVAAERAAAVAAGDRNAGLPTEWEGSRPTPTGRRKTSVPVIEISRAASKAEALEGLERWKTRHPRRRRHSSRRTCWSTGCGDAHRSGTGSGST